MSDGQTPSAERYLWYAAFGSNLSRSRFDKYLKGGSAQLASNSLEPGARNPSDPVADTTMTVSRQLFFAWEAQKWDGGGVAFLSPVESRDASTICRLYKITVEQFEDVHMAEAGAEDPRPLDLVDLITKGSLPQYDRLYGLALHLGTHDGSPVITLTTERTDLAENCPSVGYAATIARGLVECTMMTAEEAVDYVLATRGVDQRLDRGKLLQLTSSTS